mmetsp:Transcript_14466/g.38242  ORF Transcript_14466/g.38242 Transcript_14466/m.38242 type:complete len:216 (-) Transcript_14466:55-702(-)
MRLERVGRCRRQADRRHAREEIDAAQEDDRLAQQQQDDPRLLKGARGGPRVVATTAFGILGVALAVLPTQVLRELDADVPAGRAGDEQRLDPGPGAKPPAQPSGGAPPLDVVDKRVHLGQDVVDEDAGLDRLARSLVVRQVLPSHPRIQITTAEDSAYDFGRSGHGALAKGAARRQRSLHRREVRGREEPFQQRLRRLQTSARRVAHLCGEPAAK